MAINDTSSLVAAGQTWAGSHGNDTALNYATIVKLTRTLAIIPITLVLAVYRSKKNTTTAFNFSKIFPWFILFFLLAAIISTVFNINSSITKPISESGKFFITMAMGAVGLNTNIIKLIKTSGKPIVIGLCCWISIAFVSLITQQLLHIW